MKQQLQQQQCWDSSFYISSGWPKFTYVINPSHQRRDAWPTNCTPKDAYASVFFYTSGTPHTGYIHAWPFRLSLLVSFFLPFGDAMKGIHSTQLHCHISFFSFVWLTTCFLSSQGWFLNSHKFWLFCLHIQQTTHCLFEWQTPVRSSEAAVCGFCLSISLHLFQLTIGIAKLYSS